MLAQVVGARVQRDVDGRDDQDAEADAVLAKLRDMLRFLLTAREPAQPKALILAVVQELGEVYRTAPASAAPAASAAYRARVVYGDAVGHAQAIADVVELLAIGDLHPEADPSAYVAALRSACAPDISRLVDDGVDVE